LKAESEQEKNNLEFKAFCGRGMNGPGEGLFQDADCGFNALAMAVLQE
jgi:hypothetical protein